MNRSLIGRPAADRAPYSEMSLPNASRQSLLHHEVPHSSHDRLRRFHLQLERAVLVSTRINPRFGFEHGESLPFFLRDAQMPAADAIFIDHLIDAREQTVQPRAFAR